MSVSRLERRSFGPQATCGAVLFADLRGYTGMAERLDPLTVAGLLEEFFGVLAPAVEQQGGTVFHLAGDTLMAGFGLSEPAPVAVRRALDSARAMVGSFAALAQRWQHLHGLVAGVGVGLHAGDLAHAELGPPPIRRRTLIGDTVNVAARLCERARAGEILFSDSVRGPLEPAIAEHVVALPALVLRGRRNSMPIFCLPAHERLALDPWVVRRLRPFSMH